MEWHHFEYFKMLAETEHVTLSAKQLSVSQSALSRAILKLEEELEVQLFDRRGRHIYLNVASVEKPISWEPFTYLLQNALLFIHSM